MSWKKHFTRYDGGNNGATPRGSANRWQSWLPEVYSGQPNRVERYTQYDHMDMDSEINTALDTISEFSTQADSETDLPFTVAYHDETTESETKAIETSLQQWVKINEFDRRIFNIFRNAIKYGDHFFIRDPETFKLIWVNPEDVTKAIVNESAGKEIDQYIIKNVSLNLQDLVTTDTKKVQNTGMDSSAGFVTQPNKGSGIYKGQSNSNNTEYAVDSGHVIHVAMTDGMTTNWPFGLSILESVFKVYKQKELLEDSIIIYRVQRAPERRVFYVDVGNMPAHKAMGFVERVKNEVHQTRIPNRNGGGASVMDASYNPLSIMEDYFFAQTAEGRGSKVEVLQGGSNLGEIDDLKYFNNKLMRGLRVPSSYLPTGLEDGTASYNDGRVGTALIQEYRFSKYCERLQKIIQPVLDREFKLFLKHRGIEVSSNMFDLTFNEAQSFSQYRDIEIETSKAGLYSQLEGVDYLSRRFILKKYLGLSEEEMVDNERMWREENTAQPTPGEFDNDPRADLGGLGVRGGDISGFEPTDLDGDGDIDDDDQEIAMGGGLDSPISGNEGVPADIGDTQNAIQ